MSIEISNYNRVFIRRSRSKEVAVKGKGSFRIRMAIQINN